MWNPIDSQVRRWARDRSSILRHHLTPHGPEATALRAVGVPEHTIDSLYPATLTEWKAGAYALIEQGKGKPSRGFDFDRLAAQHIFSLMRYNYASTRELAIALDDGVTFPALRVAWWAVAANNAGSPTLFHDALALVCLLTHMLATQDFDISSNFSPEKRWELNFPSYCLIVDDLCKTLAKSD